MYPMRTISQAIGILIFTFIEPKPILDPNAL
jgi:hypothetical protein